MGFDFAPYSGAISSVSDLVGGVIKRIWPEKASELDKLKIEQETALFLTTQQGQAALNEFADRASARELAAKDVEKGNWFTNVLSATVRPVFGYACMAAFLGPLALRVASIALGRPMPEISLNDIEREIILSVIYFFFGGRTIEKGISLWKGIK